MNPIQELETGGSTGRLAQKEQETEARKLFLKDDDDDDGNTMASQKKDSVSELDQISPDGNVNSSLELRRRKGALAFLPDLLQYFPYQADAWDKDPFPQLVTSRYRRCNHDIEVRSLNTETIETNCWIAASTSVALFLVDPRQPSSRRFVPLLVRRLVQSSNTTVRGILVIMSEGSFDKSFLEYLEHSGLAFTHLSTCSPFLPQVLSWTSCPALTVCTSLTGRKVSVAAEEMALGWYSYGDDPDPVLRAWNAGSSALSWRQQTAAALWVPSCVVQ